MKKLLIAVATSLLFSSAAFAQCANCGADKNKADREKTEREAHNQKDKADKQQMKESLGTGTARDAAEKAQSHNEKNEKALEDVDKN